MEKQLGELRLQQNALNKRLDAVKGKEVVIDIKGGMTAGEVAVAASRAHAIEGDMAAEISIWKERCERAERIAAEGEQRRLQRQTADIVARDVKAELDLVMIGKRRVEETLHDTQTKYGDACRKLAEVETHLSRANSTTETLQETVYRLEMDNTELRRVLQENMVQLTHARDDSSTERDVAAVLQQRVESLEVVLASSEAKLIDLTNSKHKLETALKRQSAEMSRRGEEADNDVTTLEAELHDLKIENERVLDKLAVFEQSASTQGDLLVAKEETIVALENRVEQLLFDTSASREETDNQLIMLQTTSKDLMETRSVVVELRTRVELTDEDNTVLREDLSRLKESADILRTENRKLTEREKISSVSMMEAEQRRVEAGTALSASKTDVSVLRADLTEATRRSQSLLSDLNTQRRGAEQAREAARSLAVIEAERDALQEELTQALLIQQTTSSQHTTEIRRITEEVQSLRASEASLHELHRPCGETILMLKQQLGEEQMVNEKLSERLEGAAVELRDREVLEERVGALSGEVNFLRKELEGREDADKAVDDVAEARRELKTARGRWGELSADVVGKISSFLSRMDGELKGVETDMANHMEIVRTLTFTSTEVDSIHVKLQHPGSCPPVAAIAGLRSRLKAAIAKHLTDSEKHFLGINTSTLPKNVARAAGVTSNGLRDLKQSLLSLEAACHGLDGRLDTAVRKKSMRRR